MKKTIKIFVIVLTVFSIIALAVFMYLVKSTSGESVPEIKFDTDIIEAKTSATDEELLKGVTATDAEDGDVTDSLLVEGISRLIGDNTATVTYAAFDSNNHVSKAQRTIKFTDYSKPRFSLNSPLLFKNSRNIDILEYIEATDVFDGDVSKKIKYTLEDDSLVLSAEGIHKVQFRVTNSKGDTSYISLPVEIAEGDPNPYKLTLTDYLIYLPLNAEFEPENYFVKYTVAGEVCEDFDDITIEDELDTSVAGIYTVKYTYKTQNSTGHNNLMVVVG